MESPWKVLFISESFSALCFMIFPLPLAAVNESLTAGDWHFLVAFINQSETLKCFFWLLPQQQQFFMFILFANIDERVAISFGHLISLIWQIYWPFTWPAHTFYNILRLPLLILSFLDVFDFIWIIYFIAARARVRAITKCISLRFFSLCLAAQITQWDMIFYGTETPAQPSDQANPSQANQFNLYGNDMAHNDIEYDSTGQWRNMQQVSPQNPLFIWAPKVQASWTHE